MRARPRRCGAPHARRMARPRAAHRVAVVLERDAILEQELLKALWQRDDDALRRVGREARVPRAVLARQQAARRHRRGVRLHGVPREREVRRRGVGGRGCGGARRGRGGHEAAGRRRHQLSRARPRRRAGRGWTRQAPSSRPGAPHTRPRRRGGPPGRRGRTPPPVRRPTWPAVRRDVSETHSDASHAACGGDRVAAAGIRRGFGGWKRWPSRRPGDEVGEARAMGSGVVVGRRGEGRERRRAHPYSPSNPARPLQARAASCRAPQTVEQPPCAPPTRPAAPPVARAPLRAPPRTRLRPRVRGRRGGPVAAAPPPRGRPRPRPRRPAPRPRRSLSGERRVRRPCAAHSAARRARRAAGRAPRCAACCCCRSPCVASPRPAHPPLPAVQPPPPPPPPPNADLIVVGGSPEGCLAAYSAARAGRKVILIPSFGLAAAAPPPPALQPLKVPQHADGAGRGGARGQQAGLRRRGGSRRLLQRPHLAALHKFQTRPSPPRSPTRARCWPTWRPSRRPTGEPARTRRSRPLWARRLWQPLQLHRRPRGPTGRPSTHPLPQAPPPCRCPLHPAPRRPPRAQARPGAAVRRAPAAALPLPRHCA
jgi:hypothetical protein